MKDKNYFIHKYKIKFFLLIIFALLYKFNLLSQNFSDLNKEPTIHIDLSKDKDSTSDIKEDATDDVKDTYSDRTDDLFDINEWYTRGNFFILQTGEYGISSDNDFLSERFLFKYRFKSKTRHASAIRAYHIGYTIGLFNHTFKFFNFGIFVGYEYFYKIFSNLEGFFFWTDFGICNRGFAFNTGIGIGNRVKNGFELYFTYLHNVGFFNRLEFYFLLAKIFTIRGMLGLDIKHNDFIYIEKYSFLTGSYIGFLIKNIFRFEIGGGIVLDEFSNFGGFGSISIAINIL